MARHFAMPRATGPPRPWAGPIRSGQRPRCRPAAAHPPSIKPEALPRRLAERRLAPAAMVSVMQPATSMSRVGILPPDKVSGWQAEQGHGSARGGRPHRRRTCQPAASTIIKAPAAGPCGHRTCSPKRPTCPPLRPSSRGWACGRRAARSAQAPPIGQRPSMSGDAHVAAFVWRGKASATAAPATRRPARGQRRGRCPARRAGPGKVGTRKGGGHGRGLDRQG